MERARIPPAQPLGLRRGSGAGVENHAGRQAHQLQPFEHARADLLLEPRGRKIGRRGTLERAPSARLVNAVFIHAWQAAA